MKTFVRHAALLVAVAVVCQAGIARADGLTWLSGNGQSTTMVGEEKAKTTEQAPCSSCNQTACCDGTCATCESCDPCADMMGCNACPGRGIVGFAGLDSFKGISDGSYQSNFGAVTGLNASMPVPGLDDYGIGWQLGMSYGIYDLDGRTPGFNTDRAETQQQVFVTTGFFHKATCDQRLSFGLVYDWMLNDQWGVFGTDPTLGQWRGQVEYALSGCNSVGLWGCQRDLGATNYVLGNGTVTTRALTQVNLFWHHKFCSGADSWLYVGVPEHSRLTEDGSLIDWTVGANVQVPLSDHLALYANGSYAHPSAAAGNLAAVESSYDVSMGVVWYFGGHAVNHSINGACWLPYMPVANNSTFLVDQNPTYYP